MTTNIKSSGLELTPAIREYCISKISLLEHLIPNSASARMEVQLEKTSAHHQKGQVFRAEMNLVVLGGLRRAEAVADDLHTAIDLCKNEMARELRSFKTRKESLYMKGARFIKSLLRRN
ncbi:MAG TPA: ribosome-associated translation inhibitor RaiA [Candidatus Paceibacterota bacterium]